MNSDVRGILQSLRDGKISVEEALLELKTEPFEDIGCAKVDFHRRVRQGAAEVIYGEGKTPEQIAAIARTMVEHGQVPILITRLSAQAATEFCAISDLTLDYRSDARIGIVGEVQDHGGVGNIVIATGGTSDIPVAEEAAVTAEFYGNKVVRLYDVGVAGLHRLLSHIEDIMSATVIVAVAGMEGALPGVIAGLVDCPVIAVPTSIGYGASFGGLAALLAMLNSCASGLSIVNIDNGFGAGYLANMINHMGEKR